MYAHRWQCLCFAQAVAARLNAAREQEHVFERLQIAAAKAEASAASQRAKAAQFKRLRRIMQRDVDPEAWAQAHPPRPKAIRVVCEPVTALSSDYLRRKKWLALVALAARAQAARAAFTTLLHEEAEIEQELEQSRRNAAMRRALAAAKARKARDRAKRRYRHEQARIAREQEAARHGRSPTGKKPKQSKEKLAEGDTVKEEQQELLSSSSSSSDSDDPVHSDAASEASITSWHEHIQREAAPFDLPLFSDLNTRVRLAARLRFDPRVKVHTSPTQSLEAASGSEAEASDSEQEQEQEEEEEEADEAEEGADPQGSKTVSFAAAMARELATAPHQRGTMSVEVEHSPQQPRSDTKQARDAAAQWRASSKAKQEAEVLAALFNYRFSARHLMDRIVALRRRYMVRGVASHVALL